MTFSKPKWTTKPAGGWVAELADIASNKPDIDAQSVTVLEWAYGVALSYAVATRSSPDALESIYREAVKDYYSDVEQKIADALMAVDQPCGVGAGIGAGIAAFYGDERQPPQLLVCAPDIYGDLVDVVDTVPTYATGSVSGASLTGTIAGLEVVVSPHLPAGTELITARGVVELRETSPVRLTANVIGALKVELGVTAFAAIDTERPNAVHSLTPAAGAPVGLEHGQAHAQERIDVTDWITTGDVAGDLDVPDDAGDVRLSRSVDAVRAAVERRRSDLDYTDADSVPADVRAGAVAWACVMYQSRSAPAGFAGFDAETALIEAGSRRAEILRLLGFRRPVVA